MAKGPENGGENLEQADSRGQIARLNLSVKKSRRYVYSTDIRPPVDTSGFRLKIEDELKKLTDITKVVEKVEDVADLRKLSLGTLIKLEDKYEGILMYAFTDVVGAQKKIDFSQWEQNYKKPKKGTRLQVDFRGNIEAEAKLGAGDFLPPSVRSVKVFEDGDSKRVRTSLKRVGLKGRNVEGRGFFDNDGYIPVFSGDVVEIGDVDEGFDQKYRKKLPDGTSVLDEKAYEQELQKEQEWVKKVYERNPTAQRGKNLSEQELQALMERMRGLGVGDRVAKLAVEIANGKQITGKCCWDWVHKVYKAAGARPRRIYQDLNYTGRFCGEHHADERMLSTVRPGDWLYINNENQYTKGAHSVIFLEWIDRASQLARCASMPKAGRHGRIHTVNIARYPVVHISKPVAA